MDDAAIAKLWAIEQLTGYVLEWKGEGIDFVAHLDGVPWYEAAPPPRKHKCWAQTNGYMNGHRVQRCACGAFGPEPFILLFRDTPRVADDPGPRRLIMRGMDVLRRRVRA